MIAELLTGLIAGFTSGYLYRDRQEDKEKTDILKGTYAGKAGVERLKRMAGIGEPVDKVTISGDTNNATHQYWWQEYGSEKHYKKNGKYPETKSEMDTIQKNNWMNLKQQEEEGEIHLTKEAKKQYRSWEKL